MKLRMSCDDGCASDLRLAKLASKYGVDCVFYWPVEWQGVAKRHGYEPLTYSQALSIAEEFEIGSHGITHEHLTKMDSHRAIQEIVESKYMLQRLFGKKITKFCPSRGYTNEELTKATVPLYESQRLTKGDGLVHVHPDSGANGNMPWAEYARSHKVSELWMHSWELDRFALWGELEDYLKEATHG